MSNPVLRHAPTYATHNLIAVYELIKSGAIVVNPVGDEQDKWTQQHNQFFIQGILHNQPIGQFSVHRDCNGTMMVIDGTNRLTAIMLFMNGQYATQDGPIEKGRLYSELSDQEQMQFNYTQLPFAQHKELTTEELHFLASLHRSVKAAKHKP